MRLSIPTSDSVNIAYLVYIFTYFHKKVEKMTTYTYLCKYIMQYFFLMDLDHFYRKTKTN